MAGYTVFIGDVALDEYYEAARWPAIKEKIAVEAHKPRFGGMIANAACVYASMGETARFLGVLNSGAISRMLLDNLEESGVDTSLVVFDDTLPDSKTIIILAEGEHTVFIPELHVERIPISEAQLEELCGADYIYSTATEMARLRCGAFSSEDIIAKLRARGVKLVYDMDVGYLAKEEERYYRPIDIVFFNEAGFAHYCGGRSGEEAVRTLLSYGMEAVVVTKAEEGCEVYSPAGAFASPALPAAVADVTGAGDTFCASFLFAYKKSGDLRYAARFAAAAATICVENIGARAGAVGEAAVLARMEAGTAAK